MKMKKILSVAAVLAIAASLGVSASADTATPVSDNKVTITKNYTVNGTTAVNPADTLTFTVEDASVANGAEGAVAAISDLTIDNVSVTKGDKTENIVVNLPTYNKVGVYTYKIKENAGSVVGVDYRSKSFYLVVTVVNGENGLVTYANVYDSDTDGFKADTKLNAVVNTYTAGSLKITEETKGTLGDSNDEFTETVTFTVPGGVKAKDVVTVDTENATVTWEDDNTAKITVNNGDEIVFGNLPKDTTYDVTQTDKSGYTAKTTFNDDKVITASEEDSVKITNERNADIGTGINLDNLPYALALAGVAVAGGSIVIRRRRVND